MKRFFGATAAATLVFGGLAFTTATPAAAAAGNCTALKDVKVKKFDPDPVRVIASCSFLGAASEARGYLDMLGCCDKETSWFRQVNTNYYSSWATGNYERVGIDYRDR